MDLEKLNELKRLVNEAHVFARDLVAKGESSLSPVFQSLRNAESAVRARLSNVVLTEQHEAQQVEIEKKSKALKAEAVKINAAVAQGLEKLKEVAAELKVKVNPQDTAKSLAAVLVDKGYEPSEAPSAGQSPLKVETTGTNLGTLH